MGLFSTLVKTTIETVKLPVAIAMDVISLGNVDESETFTEKQLDEIKRASQNDEEF